MGGRWNGESVVVRAQVKRRKEEKKEIQKREWVGGKMEKVQLLGFR